MVREDAPLTADVGKDSPGIVYVLLSTRLSFSGRRAQPTPLLETGAHLCPQRPLDKSGRRDTPEDRTVSS
jgi:hypothetical protein